MRLSYCFVALMLFACSDRIDYGYVKSEAWLYTSGYHDLGDYIAFDRNGSVWSIRGDTLFKHGDPVARLISLDKGDNEITLMSLKGDDRAVYTNTIEFTR